MKAILFLLLSLIFINYSDAQFGNSLYFNGATDYVEIPDNDSLDIIDEFTIEAWVQAKEVDTMLILMKGWCATNDYSYYLRVKNGFIQWVFNSLGDCTNGSNVYTSDSVVVFDGDCAHIAVVHTSASVQLYKNGIPISGSFTSGYNGPVHNSNEPLLLGAYKFLSGNFGMHYYGTIDELRFWSKALTVDEINNRLTNPLVGDESGLVAYYDMNQNDFGDGIIIQNKALITGSQLNGIAVGSTSSPSYTLSCVQGTNIIDHKKHDFVVFPNPAIDVIQLETDRFSTATYKIYNNIGQLIDHGEIKNYCGQNKINVSRFPSGLYNLVLIINNSNMHTLFIKK